MLKFSIYPVLGYQPETSMMFGAIGFIVFSKSGSEQSDHFRPSNISPYFLYTLNNQMLFAIDVELYLNNDYNLQFKPRLYNYPDFFFGIGNGNEPEDEEIYTNVFQQVEGTFMKFTDEEWSLGIRFDIQHNTLRDFSENGQLISSGLPGLRGGFNVGIGPAAQYDSRDNILYPGKGAYLRSEVNFYSDALGGDFNYTLFKIDLRKYFSIKNSKIYWHSRGWAILSAGRKCLFTNCKNRWRYQAPGNCQ
ncbi:MAG: BamA/TamA family outer membrane protein [Cyclobacteriaceae bacterium]|nr:BamA/TamA family outer membrane protein [Cyclobacteriaceae bacterium]